MLEARILEARWVLFHGRENDRKIVPEILKGCNGRENDRKIVPEPHQSHQWMIDEHLALVAFFHRHDHGFRLPWPRCLSIVSVVGFAHFGVVFFFCVCSQTIFNNGI